MMLRLLQVSESSTNHTMPTRHDNGDDIVEKAMVPHSGNIIAGETASASCHRIQSEVNGVCSPSASFLGDVVEPDPKSRCM